MAGTCCPRSATASSPSVTRISGKAPIASTPRMVTQKSPWSWRTPVGTMAVFSPADVAQAVPPHPRRRGALSMADPKIQTVIFVCTANYYRSRYSEHLFNVLAQKRGLPWRATSRGLRTWTLTEDDGPISDFTVWRLAARGIDVAPDHRHPPAVDRRRPPPGRPGDRPQRGRASADDAAAVLPLGGPRRVLARPRPGLCHGRRGLAGVRTERRSSRRAPRRRDAHAGQAAPAIGPPGGVNGKAGAERTWHQRGVAPQGAMQ